MSPVFDDVSSLITFNVLPPEGWEFNERIGRSGMGVTFRIKNKEDGKTATWTFEIPRMEIK